MRAFAVWLNRLLWTGIVTVVLTVGAVVALGRYYVPYLDRYQDVLLEELRERTGLIVSVGTISAEWRPLRPRLDVTELTLHHPDHPEEVVARIDRLALRLDLLESLRRWVPAFSGVEGSGLRVTLEEQPLGRWQLRGFPPQDAGSGGGRLLDFLLAIRSAAIDDSRIDLDFYHGGRGELFVDELILSRSGRFRRLQLAATTATSGAPLQMVVESRGDPRQRDAFRAGAYLQFTGLDLTSVLPAARSFGIDLRHGLLSGRAWFSWERGDVTVRGDVAVPQIDLGALIGHPAPPVTDFRARFLMSEQPGERQLWLSDIAAEWGEIPVALERLWLRQRGAATEQFELAVPALELAQLRDLLDRDDLLPPLWREAIAGMAPTGTLRALHLTLPTAPRHRDRLLARAEFDALALQPWRESPGVTGGRGYVEIDLDGGRGWVDAPELALAFPSVYDEPIALRDARGRVDWRIDREQRRVAVASSVLSAATADNAPARVRLALDLPIHAGAEAPPAMTLLIGMGETSAEAALAFVPRTLPPTLTEWLAAARPSGALERAGFVFRGSLRGADHAGRTVQLFADIREGAFSFHPDWPRLEQASGQLWIDDGSVTAIATSGRLLDDLLVEQARVAVMAASDNTLQLSLVTRASGSGNGWLRLFQETPLRRQLGDWIDALSWQGGAAAELALHVPLTANTAGEQVGIALRGELSGGELQLQEPAVSLTHIHGAVTFRQGELPESVAAAVEAAAMPDGLMAPALTAQLHGRPVQLAVNSAADGYQLTASTSVAVADWAALLPSPVPELVRGSTPVAISGRWAAGRGSITLESDLRGIEIDLPAPFHKLSSTALPLRATVGLRPGSAESETVDAQLLNQRAALAARLGRMPTLGRARGPRTDLEATLGEWGALTMEWRGLSPRRGALRVGSSSTAALAQPGTFVVTGDLPPVAAAPWRALAERIDFTPTEGRRALMLLLDDIRTPELTLFGRQLADVSVSGGRAPAGWRLFFGSDLASGELRFPSEPEAVPQLQLRELRLVRTAENLGTEPTAGADPGRLMAIDVDIAALWIDQQNWGSLGFRMRPVADGVRVTDLTGELRGLRFGEREGQPSELIWLRSAAGEQTRFEGRLAVERLGRALELWGFEPVVQGRDGWLDASVSWPGAPMDFAVTALSGRGALEVGEGRFLKAPGTATGALKVVGVFNLANLVRRLRLDFSDLFSDGIAFDQIEGSFQLHNGLLTTGRPLSVVSPSSRFRLAGALDFDSGGVDMELTATLPLATNLPWVAVLAGGLPAAAGIYVVSKLLGDEVDRFSSAVYSVEGDWRDPEIRFRRLFGDGDEDAASREAGAPAQ